MTQYRDLSQLGYFNAGLSEDERQKILDKYEGKPEPKKANPEKPQNPPAKAAAKPE